MVAHDHSHNRPDSAQYASHAFSALKVNLSLSNKHSLELSTQHARLIRTNSLKLSNNSLRPSAIDQDRSLRDRLAQRGGPPTRIRFVVVEVEVLFVL